MNESTSYPIHLSLTEKWIQKLADEKDLSIAAGDQYQLHHFRIKIEPGLMILNAEIMDKPGSVIMLACSPKWDAGEQKIILEEVEIKTRSRNLLVKSAGWVASTFMQDKIDKKIEQQINQLYKKYLDKLITAPFILPIKGHGMVSINANALFIQKIDFVEGSIDLEIEVYGKINLELNST